MQPEWALTRKCVWVPKAETGTRELVEHTANDSYWGDGGDGTGQNKLGKLLMQVRDEVKGELRAK